MIRMKMEPMHFTNAKLPMIGTSFGITDLRWQVIQNSPVFSWVFDPRALANAGDPWDKHLAAAVCLLRWAISTFTVRGLGSGLHSRSKIRSTVRDSV